MRFLSIKTRVTIYFTLMMVLIVVLVIGVILIAGRGVISDSAEGTLLDVVHDEIDDVDFDGGFLDLDELDFYRHNVYVRPTTRPALSSAERGRVISMAQWSSATAKYAG